MSCYVMLRYVILCHVMSRHVMLYYVSEEATFKSHHTLKVPTWVFIAEINSNSVSIITIITICNIVSKKESRINLLERSKLFENAQFSTILMPFSYTKHSNIRHM